MSVDCTERYGAPGPSSLVELGLHSRSSLLLRSLGLIDAPGYLGQQQLGRLPRAARALPRRLVSHVVQPHSRAPIARRLRTARAQPRARRTSRQKAIGGPQKKDQ
jgi:hypothetical protein